MEFGIYFQCYKQPYAIYKALESIRMFYKDCTIILLSDNGYDYSEIAKYFNCTYHVLLNQITYCISIN